MTRGDAVLAARGLPRSPRNATSGTAAGDCRPRSSPRRTGRQATPARIVSAILALTAGMQRAALAVDVDDALHGDERAAGRMVADLLFGEKTHRLERTEDRNVEPGDMVGDDQLLRLDGEVAVQPHPDAEPGAKQALEPDRRPPADAPAESLRDPPRRTEDRNERGKRQDRERRAASWSWRETPDGSSGRGTTALTRGLYA